VRIAACAACDMLPIAMATLSVTNGTGFDVFIWMRDLNTLGRAFVLDGARLNKNANLSVQLQADGDGNLSYHWAAEQILEQRALHWTDVVNKQAAVDAAGAPATLTVSDATTKGTVLPYMFRPYP
jgi:hypothetical protein